MHTHHITHAKSKAIIGRHSAAHADDAQTMEREGDKREILRHTICCPAAARQQCPALLASSARYCEMCNEMSDDGREEDEGRKRRAAVLSLSLKLKQRQ